MTCNINVPLTNIPRTFPQEEFIYSKLLTDLFYQAKEKTTCRAVLQANSSNDVCAVEM